MNIMQWVEQKYAKKTPEENRLNFKAGDTVKVHVKIKEGDKERVQVFQGTVISIHNNGAGTTFTVRKVSFGVGVERIFPAYAPTVQKIELVNSGKVRRAKLYYLRALKGRAARIVTLDKPGKATVFSEGEAQSVETEGLAEEQPVTA